MSYSYITSVFPKFEYSNVYDANLYNNISGLNKKQFIDNIKFNGLNEATQYQEINKKYVEPMDIKPMDIKPMDMDIKPMDINLEMYKNIENNGLLSENSKFLSQNNQTYYNQPAQKQKQKQIQKQIQIQIPSNIINSNMINDTNVLTNKTQLQKSYSSNLSNQIPTNYNYNYNDNELTESFSENSHEVYTKHILECEQCKQLLLKQFNIETERIRNEEILELITFLIFGLFILLLLDGFKK